MYMHTDISSCHCSMWFGVVITVMFVILYRSSLHFLCFSVSLYHFGFVLCKLVVTGLSFFSTKQEDWLVRTSQK